MSSRLFVGGLAPEVTEKDLFDLFSNVDQVDQVAIIKDRATSSSRGFGFVEMGSVAGATAAKEALHGKQVKGRTIRVDVAKPSKKWEDKKRDDDPGAPGVSRDSGPVVVYVPAAALGPQDPDNPGLSRDTGPMVAFVPAEPGSAAEQAAGTVSRETGPVVAFVPAPPGSIPDQGASLGVGRETGPVVTFVPAVPTGADPNSPGTPKRETGPIILMPATPQTPTERGAVEEAEPVAARRRAIPWTLAAFATVVALGMFLFWQTQKRPSVPPHPQAVLVMPVEVIGQSEAAEYLSFAFAQSLAVNLATVEDLRVLPVPKVVDAALKERASEFARERGAGKLVSSTLTSEGTQTQISLTVVDTIDDRILWGTQAQGPKTELLAIAGRLAGEVAEKLGAVLPTLHPLVTELTGSPAMAESPHTTDALGAIRRVDLGAALIATERLVTDFPKEPAALTLRVHALILRWDAARSPANFRAVQAALAALDATDKGYPYSDFYRAYILYNEGRDREAIAGFTRIIEAGDLSPAARGWVLRYRAFGRQRLSDTAGALADLQESLRLDPANPWTLNIMSGVLLETGQAEDAARRAKQALALLPSNWRNHQAHGEALTALGKLEEAAAAFGKACELSPSQSPCAGHGLLLVKVGETERAAEVIERAKGFPDTIYGTYNLACYSAITGEREPAIAYLQKSVELGMVDLMIKADADLESLHGDEAFDQLVRTVEGRVAGTGDGPPP